ncbi:MAG: hypothetical protein SynsKO_26810 [Synoicihabitans sp.]
MLPRRFISALVSPLSALGLLFLTGCESVPAETTTAQIPKIHVGMKVATLDAALENPIRVEPATEYNRMEETRHYVVEHPSVYRPITTGMRDVPYVDPITGEMRMLKEPIAAEQRVDREEKIVVVIRHDQVISVDRRISENSSFSR